MGNAGFCPSTVHMSLELLRAAIFMERTFQHTASHWFGSYQFPQATNKAEGIRTKGLSSLGCKDQGLKLLGYQG